MKVIFSESAFRQLLKFEKIFQKRIINKLDFFLSKDNPLDFAERLTNHQFGDWRFRVGDHRILFDVEKDRIIILRIRDRKDSYK